MNRNDDQTKPGMNNISKVLSNMHKIREEIREADIFVRNARKEAFRTLVTCLVLMVYFLAIAFYAEYLRSIHGGGEYIFKAGWVITGLSLILIEILNQTTYYMSRSRYRLACIVKAVFFWLIVTSGYIVYIALLKERPLSTKESSMDVLTILLFSFCLPLYSLSPEVRFLLLA
ncbi:MAG: hypothetical protein ACYS8Z_20070, partial [Planctomycetota bacterium]